jgi:cellulose synthase (UDP-forming)
MSQQTRHVDVRSDGNVTYADRGLDTLDGSETATPSPRTMARELRISAGLLMVTVVATVLFLRDAVEGAVHLFEADDVRAVAEQAVLLIVLAFLIFGNLVYQVARVGYLRRYARHRPVPGDDLAEFGAGALPSLVTLVPSYREERRVVAQTLLSAALQRYPSRVVLLIDDPPAPADDGAREALEAMRLLPAEIESRLAAPAGRIADHRRRFERQWATGPVDAVAATMDVADLWEMADRWFGDEVRRWTVNDHTDAFFVEHILRRPRRQAGWHAAELRRLAPVGGLDRDGLVRELTALENLFGSELTSFERKRYVNLSHEPNKAMNLNTYIDLLGRSLCEVQGPDGVQLLPAGAGQAQPAVPAADYVMTLDADSLLSPDYALRLVYELERAGNERLAVIQTPYCAVPGPDSILERTAGATTDIQHIFHQGSTSFGATSWVGANAVLRRRALHDIRRVEHERGFPVARYIQDRTVIEDTESSIDLVAAGWGLHNYPDRLAVSATPPDFGALVIQRRRWANGGLIILPKLFRYLASRPRRRKVAEGAVRFHYLSSIAGANIGLFILLSYPFEKTLSSPWLPVTALPYFLLYARDLRHVGYRKRTVVGVYALNLALIPVNLAGVAKSIHQAVTGKKVPFARTPKVSGRTRVPAGYVAAEFLILSYWTFGASLDLSAGRWWHAAFGAANIALLAYALAFFVGLREAGADLVAPLERLRRC